MLRVVIVKTDEVDRIKAGGYGHADLPVLTSGHDTQFRTGGLYFICSGLAFLHLILLTSCSCLHHSQRGSSGGNKRWRRAIASIEETSCARTALSQFSKCDGVNNIHVIGLSIAKPTCKVIRCCAAGSRVSSDTSL